MHEIHEMHPMICACFHQATDRPLERFELYQQQLPNVASVSYHVHPAKDEEVRGLCSSLAFSLGREVKLMSSSELERCLDMDEMSLRLDFYGLGGYAELNFSCDSFC